MPDRVFCVDFGAAHTKVALRTAVQEPTGLVQVGPGVLDFWAPTVVVADWSAGRSKPELEFGESGAGYKPGPKVVVYKNFKRDLFSTLVNATPRRHPLEELVYSDEFGALAARYSVTPAWVQALRSMVQAAQAAFGGPEAPGATETRKQDEAKAATHHYFKWLHGQVLQACQKLPHIALSYGDIPVRIAVPVLSRDADLNTHPGCVRLREALTGTGWKLDDRSFVSEPESNAVGILTKATNALTKKKLIHLGGMFDRGPLVTVLKGDKNHPTYRALVVDVGAFTTDFAALTLDTGGKPTDPSEGIGFTIQRISVEWGISDLDACVRAALPEDKREALEQLSPRDFAEFQIRAYTDDTGFRLPDRRVLGGAADRPLIEKCLDTFATRLAAETATFIQQLAPSSMQELILTGGGSNIPVVREALIKAAASTPGNPFVKTHAPGLKKTKAGPPVDPLDDKFARGASALGGASIYFEKSYY